MDSSLFVAIVLVVAGLPTLARRRSSASVELLAGRDARLRAFTK